MWLKRYLRLNVAVILFKVLKGPPFIFALITMRKQQSS